ncbi:MAG: aspC 3 [Candidatus Berkelbacteria bacterium]|nr:aspC 3 [Candidatus Berkelbacteria bacterium]
MIKLQQFIYVCAPSFAQKAAEKALEISLKEKINQYREKKDIIFTGLKRYYQITEPLGAFYVFVKTPEKEDEFVKTLVRNNIIVVPGRVFSQKSGYIRISYATKKANIYKAIKIFQKIAIIR